MPSKFTARQIISINRHAKLHNETFKKLQWMINSLERKRNHLQEKIRFISETIEVYKGIPISYFPKECRKKGNLNFSTSCKEAESRAARIWHNVQQKGMFGLEITKGLGTGHSSDAFCGNVWLSRDQVILAAKEWIATGTLPYINGDDTVKKRVVFH